MKKLDAICIGRVISMERVRYGNFILPNGNALGGAVLALILGIAKVTIMWLSYKESKKHKDTDCDK